MSDNGSAALAERGKTKISAAEAIELVKKFAKDRYKADKAKSDSAIAEANNFAGGASERLDKATIDHGRQWAVRLALIARQTAGSGYQASKSGAAIAAIVKKVFGIVGELDALLATDVEIGLFERVEQRDYLGFDSLRRLSVKELQRHADPGYTIDENQIAEELIDSVGEKLQDEVEALLDQYDIEPIVMPGGEPDEDEAAGAGRGRARRKRS